MPALAWEKGQDATESSIKADSVNFTDLSVIVPVYNSASFIAESVTHLSDALGEADVDHDIIVVDDGSTDGTAERLSAIDSQRIRVLTHERNRGKGAAIKTGLEQARGRQIVFTDDDVPYGIDGVLRCYQALRRHSGLVIGDRTLAQSRVEVDIPLTRRAISGTNILLRRLFLLFPEIQDTQCGLKGFTGSLGDQVLASSMLERFSFDLELIAIAANQGAPITRIPVVQNARTDVSPRLMMESVIAARDLLHVAWASKMGQYKVREPVNAR